MATAEYIVQIDQDLFLTFLLDDPTKFPNPVLPPVAVAAPTLTSLSPNTAEVGSAPVEVTLTGTGFTWISRVLWNGGIEDAILVSATQIKVMVHPETASGPWTIPVNVLNSSMKSNSVNFSFTDPDPEEE